jgi:hypothetical protein
VRVLEHIRVQSEGIANGVASRDSK